REAKDALRWCGDSLGVRKELGEHHNALADFERPASGRAFRPALDHSGHLESGDEWGLGCPGINAHPLHQVGKPHSHGVDANERLARLGCRLRRLPNLENFGRTVPPYDHGAHRTPPVAVRLREFARPANSKPFGSCSETGPGVRNIKAIMRK